MKKLITSVFFALLSIGVSKAQISAGSLQKSFCEVSSPEAFAMTKYGTTHSSMYTGAFSYNIPIYTYKDIDFEIPISLGYHFDGFRPLQGSGSMGYGWYLNVGGAITREVRGVPDEHHASESVSGDDCSGYYYFKNSGKEPTSDIVSIGSGLFSGGSVRLDKAVGAYFYGTRPSYIYNGDWSRVEGDYANYETAPDVFHFSFCGKQGDFIITGENGKCSAYSCDGAFAEYKITFSPASNPSKGYNSEIIIRDGNGYYYFFGGGIDYVDYTDTSARDAGNTDWPITSWKLKKIVAPSGRSVSFIYGTRQLFVFRQYSFDTAYHYGRSSSYISGEENPKTEKLQERDALIYVVSRCLDRIEVDGKTIASFTYAIRSKTEALNNRAPHERYVIKDKCLGRIQIWNNESELIEKVTLSYNYSAPNESVSRMFLCGVASLKNGEYKFEYDNKYSFPGPETRSIDHWGYWNGKNIPKSTNPGVNFSNTIPILHVGDQDESLYNLTGTGNRDADYEYSKRGALTKITYPTGGTSEIEYEAHTAGKRWNKSVDNPTGVPETCPHVFKIGGVRVKSIRNTSSIYNHKINFRYTIERNGSISSGVLTKMPRYVFATGFQSEGTSEDPYNGSMYIYNSGQFHETRDDHMGYEVVWEEYDDSSAIEHQFCSFEDYTDGYWYAMSTYPQKYEPDCRLMLNSYNISEEGINRCAALLLPSSIDYKYVRGKEKLIREFDSNGKLRHSVEHIYQVKEAEPIYVVCNVIKGFKEIGLVQLYPQLEKTISVDYYEDGKTFSDISIFEYNELGQLSLSERESSETSQKNRIYYRYSGEQQEQSGVSCYPAPIKDIVCTTIRDSVEYLSLSQSYNYENDYSSFEREPNHRPQSIYSYYVDAATKVLNREKIFTVGRSGPLEVYSYTYDTLYHPTSLNMSGVSIKVKWDDRGKNIIERNVNELTSRYEWKDEVGMLRQVFPSGKERRYSYDSKGRLSVIKDADGQILNKYEYKIKTDGEVDPYPLLRADNYIYKTTYSDSSKNYIDIDIYDELGYLSQEIKCLYLDSKRHLVRPIVYDVHQRADALEYLPYSYAGAPTYKPNGINEQKHFYEQLYSDTSAIVVRDYEKRVNGKLLMRQRAGRRYRENGGVKQRNTYSANDDSDSIHKFSLVDKVELKGYYQSGQLRKTIQIDEDGKRIEHYENVWGRKICERRYVDSNTKSDVYYIYDTRDSLSCIIQPEGVAHLEDSFTLDGDYSKKYCFVIKRDGRGLIETEQIPGGGRKEYVYDRNSCPILISDSQMLVDSLWYRITYDSSCRPIEKSLVKSTFSPKELRSRVLYGAPLGYLIEDVCSLESTEYHAKKDSLSYGLIKRRVLYEMPKVLNKGVVQGNLTKTIDYTYDKEERVLTKTESYSNGTRSDYVYEWNLLGEKTKTIERQVAKSGSSTEYIHVMNYDARGRLSSEEESLDGWQFDSTVFRYDELGRLKSKITNGILSEEYKYDIQNWQITHELRRSINTQNEQLFEQNNAFTYSGKISETEVKHKDADPFNDGYLYDGLGRLSSTTRGEYYEYDLNSNVLRYNQSIYSYNGNHRIADTYNERGQLTKDAQRKIRIEYNIGGLTLFANKEDVSKLVEYSFFADGSKYSAISRGEGGYVYRGNFVFSVGSNAGGNEYIESIKTKNGRIINEDGSPKYIHFTNDLIGSSQVLVELNGSQSSIREQDSYLPYGRRYIDADYRTESNNRYRFSGKEEQRVGWVDTPYIDFGARFYNPENGSWLAPDAKSLSYPYLSPYSYCGGDPINYYDPDGNWIETASDVINVGLDIKDLRDAIKDGNVAGIVLNSIATVYDVAAAAVPFLPGGAGRILNGAKIGEKTASAVDVAILGIKENARSSMFRRHFIKQFGKEGLEEGVEYEVHHVFPVKFAKEFRDAGMKDINLPEYGAWVKKEEHRHTAYEYNKAWEIFFEEKKKNGEVVTLKDILAYGKVLSGKFHFETKYQLW